MRRTRPLCSKGSPPWAQPRLPACMAPPGMAMVRPCCGRWVRSSRTRAPRGPRPEHDLRHCRQIGVGCAEAEAIRGLPSTARDIPLMSQPVIGVTLDSEEPGGYSKLPWYALRQNYCEAVVRAGGLPILLPHEPSQAEAYLERIDALVVTGGAFDVDPLLFGAEARHATVKLKTRRTAFEVEIAKGALARDVPVLGICGGQQLLNVVLGGTLIQHIPDEVQGCVAHHQSNPPDEPGHTVRVIAGTLLHRITEVSDLAVNSAHHQA